MFVEWNEIQVIIHCTVLIRTYLTDMFILKLFVDTLFLGIYLFIYFFCNGKTISSGFSVFLTPPRQYQ